MEEPIYIVTRTLGDRVFTALLFGGFWAAALYGVLFGLESYPRSGWPAFFYRAVVLGLALIVASFIWNVLTVRMHVVTADGVSTQRKLGQRVISEKRIPREDIASIKRAWRVGFGGSTVITLQLVLHSGKVVDLITVYDETRYEALQRSVAERLTLH
jgi:hypothetical protein